MIRAIISASMRFRVLVVAAAAALLVVGLIRLGDTPVDVLPEFAPPTVEIQTEALGLSAAEVEQLITVPMEQDLLVGIAFVDDIRSESLPGLSRILLVFEKGTDLYRARQVVAERLTQAHALPNVSKPPQMLQPLSATNRVMMIGASSSKLSPIEMGVLARWTIAPQLSGVEGVANVSVWGFRDRQLQVQIDPKRLRDADVSLVQVIETAGNSLWFSPLSFVEASTPGTGGFIDTPNQRLGVQHRSPINSAKELARVRVQDTDERQVVLGDVATVVEDHQPLIGDAVVGDQTSDLMFVVEKLPGASTLEVTDGVEDALDAIAPGFTGVTFDRQVYRPASFIETAAENAGLLLIVGGILAALAIVAFQMRWRVALVSLVAIPVAVVVAALILWAFGAGMNVMVLAGLVAALVIVIDEAVVGVDTAVQRLRSSPTEHNGTSVATVLLGASARQPAIYALAIVALAILPLLFFDGTAGAFLPPTIGAYMLAIAAALVVSLTLTPALSMLLIRRTGDIGGEPRSTGVLKRGYSWVLDRMVPKPVIAAIVGGALVVVALIATPFLKTDLVPTFKEQQLLIRWDGPAGTSLPEMRRLTSRASAELRKLNGVEAVGAHVGRAVASDSSSNVSSAEMWVNVDPDADYDDTVQAIQQIVGGYPGVAQTAGTFSNDRAASVLATRRTDEVVVRVYGENQGVLATQAKRVEKSIKDVSGVSRTRVDLPAMQPTIEVEVDLTAAEQNGVKPGDVRRAAATLLGGLVVGNLFEQQKVFEVVVWGTPATRASLTSIRDLVVDTPDGRSVRLGDVADVRIAPNASVIRRQAVSRYVDVVASVSGRGHGDAADAIKRAVGALSFPLEYHTEILADQGQPVGRLIGLAIGVAIGIVLLLQAFFTSWRLAALAVLMLLPAVSGGVIAILLSGRTVSIGSIIGLFAVFGLAVRGVLFAMDRWRELRREHGSTASDLVRRGALDRVTPMATSAVAGLAVMIVAAIVGGGAGLELVRPIAIVLIGGLITIVLTVLVLLPPLYERFGAAVQTDVDEALDTRPQTPWHPTVAPVDHAHKLEAGS